MRFGTCVELDKVSVAQSLGFDYVDINISKMMTYSDEEFLEKKAISEKSAIKVEAGCALLPPNLVLIGPNKVA
ncbi:MAG: hypothetical protein HUK24_00835, partial [Sphaerochaetaceae bacterium]|nr:hypothetical protein [Sphaerochaetaceae bacterium]